MSTQEHVSFARVAGFVVSGLGQNSKLMFLFVLKVLGGL